MPVTGRSSVEQRAMRAIADTSRYDAPTDDRDLDAQCAIEAMRAEGLIVVPEAEAERLREANVALRQALVLIEDHARRDAIERGVAEATRYGVIARDAINKNA